MRHEHERTGLQYQQYAQGLAEAVEQQQAAFRDAVHWQEELHKTEHRNARRYFEGMVRLCALKALHHNLIAQSFQRAGHGTSSAAFSPDNDNSAPAGPAKPSSEMAVTEKFKGALSLLGDCYRELGNERMAHTCDERARRLESTSERGFGIANGKKIEDSGKPQNTQQECSDFRGSFRSLQNAERYLEDYNKDYARVRNHARRVLESERTIQRLEAACASRPQSSVEHKLLNEAVDRGEKLKRLAETDAFDAVASHKNFQNEIESAEKGYDALSRTLSGKPAQLINRNDPAQIKESELDKPGLHDSGSDPNNLTASGHRQSRAIVAALISQTLKEIDREL
jgi:hypothetical protein